MLRQRIGVGMLVVSVVYSSLDIMGVMRPMFLRWRAHTGIDHTAAVILTSLPFKVVLLLTAAVLTFWPERPKTP